MISKINQSLNVKPKVYGQKNVSFGYNKNLNMQLIKSLEETPSDLNRTLSYVNDFCNETEQLISSKIAKNSSVLEINPLVDFLAEIKGTFAMMVDNIFPHLNYSEKESLHYMKESLKRKGEWKEVLADTLGGNEPVESGAVPPQVVEQSSKEFVLKEFMPNSESPDGFSSLGGMEEIKTNLMDKIVSTVRNPEEAELDKIEYGKKLPRGTFLFGPPGCGKTFIAEAVAREADIPFFNIKLGAIGSTFVSGNSINYTKAFDIVAKIAEEKGKPCVLFLDEIDAVAKNRSATSQSSDLGLMGTLLDLINTARSRGIILFAATNKHFIIDEAIKNRFDNQLYVGLPDLYTRVEVLKKALANRTKASELLNSSEDLEEVATRLNQFSNRTICDITEKVVCLAKNDGRRQISKEDYFKAIEESQLLKIKDIDEYKPEKKKEIGFRA